jgi:hypothetical protein
MAIDKNPDHKLFKTLKKKKQEKTNKQNKTKQNKTEQRKTNKKKQEKKKQIISISFALSSFPFLK